MLICPSDFINLILLGKRYTDRQIIQISANKHYDHLLSLKIPGVHITKAGSYERDLRTRQDKSTYTVSQNTFIVFRLRIRVGMSAVTHSVLSDLCIPNSAFTITFVMTILYLHFFRNRTISSLAADWHVDPSTIRRWKTLYEEHSTAWKLALKKLHKDCNDHISLSDSVPPFPYSFYCYFNATFLDASCPHPILSGDPLHPPHPEPILERSDPSIFAL